MRKQRKLQARKLLHLEMIFRKFFLDQSGTGSSVMYREFCSTGARLSTFSSEMSGGFNLSSLFTRLHKDFEESFLCCVRMTCEAQLLLLPLRRSVRKSRMLTDVSISKC